MDTASYSIPQYKRILVADDNSEVSVIALNHAIYLSNVTGAEIVILNIVEDIKKIQPTTISAASTQEDKEAGGAVAESIAADQKKANYNKRTSKTNDRREDKIL